MQVCNSFHFLLSLLSFRSIWKLSSKRFFMNYSKSSFILFSFSLRFNFLVGFEIFYQVFSQLESTFREFCASCHKFSLRFENFANPSDALCWIQFTSMKSKLRRGCWQKSVQLQLKHSLKFILDTVVSFFIGGNFSTQSFVCFFHDKFESSADFFGETVLRQNHVIKLLNYSFASSYQGIANSK